MAILLPKPQKTIRRSDFIAIPKLKGKQKMTKTKAKTKEVKQTRKCAVCHKAFEPAVHNEKYCSDECYKKAKKDRQAAKNKAKAVKQVAKPAKPVVDKKGKKCSCHCVETVQIKEIDCSKGDKAIIKRMEKTLSNLYTHMYGIILCFDELFNSLTEQKKGKK